MSVDHMLLVYLLVALAAILVVLVMIFFRLRRQVKETQVLASKIEMLANEALRLDPGRDYQVINDDFNKVRRMT